MRATSTPPTTPDRSTTTTQARPAYQPPRSPTGARPASTVRTAAPVAMATDRPGIRHVSWTGGSRPPRLYLHLNEDTFRASPTTRPGSNSPDHSRPAKPVTCSATPASFSPRCSTCPGLRRSTPTRYPDKCARQSSSSPPAQVASPTPTSRVDTSKSTTRSRTRRRDQPRQCGTDCDTGAPCQDARRMGCTTTVPRHLCLERPGRPDLHRRPPRHPTARLTRRGRPRRTATRCCRISTRDRFSSSSYGQNCLSQGGAGCCHRNSGC